jgi:hypothetical protein
MSDSSWSSGIPRFPAVIDAEERGSDIGTEAEDNFAAEGRRSALIRGKSLRAFLPSDRLRVIPLGLNHRAAVHSVFGRIIRVYQYSSVATLHYDPPPLLPSDHCTCLYQCLSVFICVHLWQLFDPIRGNLWPSPRSATLPPKHPQAANTDQRFAHIMVAPEISSQMVACTLTSDLQI